MQWVFPAREPGMNRRDSTQSVGAVPRLIEPCIPRRWVPPEHAGQMTDPRLVYRHPIHRAEQRLDRGPRYLAKGIRADERIDVDPHQSLGKAEGGKMRAAFCQRISSSS